MGRFEIRNARGAVSFVRWPLAVACLLSLLIVAVAGLSENVELESKLEQPDEKITLVEQQQEGAGQEFGSMESMLQWAIGHSDPEKLKMAAKDAGRLSPEELERRRNDIKELMERLRVPSDAELMEIAITDLHNSTLSTEERQRALQELLILVEPIGNANGDELIKLGGLLPVIAELERPEEELRTAAAWVLGKACQNNLVVQKQILQNRGLPRLMKMVESSSSEEAVKALYAVSDVIRNFPLGQEEFYLEGGAALLERLLGGSSVDIRLRRKSLSLVAALAEQSLAEQIHQLSGGQLDATLKASSTIPDSVTQFSERLLKGVVDSMKASDMDTLEKAMAAVRSLSNASHRIQKTLVDACRVEDTLERKKLKLLELQEDEERADFAQDLEVLWQEVVMSISNSGDLRDDL